MKRIVSIDYGQKRIGVAVSDPLGISAQPLKTVEHSSPGQDVLEVSAILLEYRPAIVIIGLPLNLDGTESESSRIVRDFAVRLNSSYPEVKIEFLDERMSSQIVDRMLTEDANISRKKRKAVRDKLAAAVILQDYLNLKLDR